jgi:hypothetical protein
MRNVAFVSLLLYATAATAGKVPTFLARQDYPISGYTVVADINGDGIPDIVAEMGSTISTLLGKGDGTFRVGPTSQPGMIIGGFVLIDLNGDGYPDAVMSAAGGGTGIGISFGNGDGSFQPAVNYPGGDKYLGQVAVGDFNGDGIPDVVIPDDQGVWLFTGKGGGVFNPGVLVSAGGYTYSNIVAADLNGDGKLDLVVSIGGFGVILGNGDGTFQPPVYYTNGSSVGNFIAVGDVNLDGFPDVAVLPDTVGRYDVLIYLNNGSGGFTSSTYAAMSSLGSFTIGDVNGDGFPDLVNEVGYVAYGYGNGKFKPAVSYPVQSSGPASGPLGPALADLRGNGLTDMIFGEITAVSVLLSAGKGRFEDGVWTSVPGSGNCGATADFNGDGRPDLALPTSEGITILLGTGTASAPYTTGSAIAVSGGAGCPIAGDLNGDGIPDLLFGSNSAGGVVAYLGNGDGTFTLASTIAVSPGTLVFGDFNHDGKLDFADSSNQLALGNGDGTFQTPVTIVANPPAEGYSWIAAGDVNNDGWTDLLLTNWNITRLLYVLLNNQQGGFTQSAIANSEGPLAVALADLNKDGNLDAVVETFYGYDVFVYLGDGTGGFTLKGRLEYEGSYPSPPAVGDVNGDGIPDMLMPSDGSIQIMLGKGDGTFKGMPSQGVGPGASQILLENLHGQPPKAHLPDIVAPDSTGGVTVLINTTK